MAGDVEKSTTDGADEVIGSHWPTDSESDAADLEKHMMDWARAHDNNQKAMTDARDYAQNEMDGAAADALATKFGYHAQVFADKMQAHLYTAGWLSMYAMAITTAKHAMNAAVTMHTVDHAGPVTEFHTQSQKDSSLHAAQQAVEAAAHNLEAAIVAVHTGISTGQTPPMTPSLGSGAGDKPPTNTHTDDQTPQSAPPADPTGHGGIYSPENTNPGLTPPAAGGPSAPAPSVPTLPASPLSAPSAGAPAAAAPPSMPRLGDPVAGAGAGGGSPMGGSPMGMGMPMGGSPMGGGMPQMPQIPSQTPGGDIAKTIGDTVGKLAGGQHNGQPVSAETLAKLMDAQNGGGAGGSGGGNGSGPGAGGPGGPGDPGGGSGGLADEKGLKPDGAMAGDDKKGGLGKHHGLDPYSAANTNPGLNDPPAPTSGPMAGPSPASPAITPTPAAGAAPMTQLSADESVPPPAAPAGAGGASTHTSAVDAAYTDPGHPGNPNGPNGSQHGAPAGAPFGQAAVNSNGNALGAYPPDGGGGAPLPPPPAQQSPMMGGGGGMPMSAAGLGAAGGAAAATPPVILSTKTEATSGESRGSSLVADPVAAATVVQVLPPEHSIAHEHLASVAKAFRERPELAWTTVGLAIGVFLYDEPGLPAPRLRYILATSDALSLIPLDVKLPAGIELLGGELTPGQRLPRSFHGDWNGHQRPALKLAAAADAYPHLVGELLYLVSNDTTEDIQPATSASSGVVETPAPRTQLDSLEKTGRSHARQSRAAADAAHITPEQAARYLDGFGRIWHFDDGSPDDIKLAAATLWAMRWGSNERRLQRPDDYVGTLATYWYIEGKTALAAGRLDEAAYAAWQFVQLDPVGASAR